MSKSTSSSNHLPIARLLSVENQVNKITAEMEKLILISTQHGSRIKELIVASSNSVSQVEMMSTVTTTRFQHMNDLKSLRKNLQAKYEDLSSGVVVQSHDEADSKDSKALTSKIDELQNEMSNSNFKANMEVNKLKMELKSSKKDYDELKRFVTVLETKLAAFLQDAKDSGMKTSIQMDDLPEITYQPTSTARRASILNPDAGIPTTPNSQSQSLSHHPSFPMGPGQGHSGMIPGAYSFMPPESQQQMQPFYPQGYPHPQGGGFDGHPQQQQQQPGSAFPYPGQGQQQAFPMPGEQMDAEQMQQLQIGYQQQMYFQQQHAAQLAQYQQHMHHPSSSTYIPGMPMTDSGLSTPGGGGGSPAYLQHAPGPHSSSARNSIYGGGGGDHNGGGHVSAAHRIIHPYGHHYPPYHMQHPAYNMSGGMLMMMAPHDAHGLGPGEDADAQLLQGLAGSPSLLSKEEKYYKAQFRAVKELIMASMECKDLALLEPQGLRAEVKHHRDHGDGDGSAAASSATATEDTLPDDGPTRQELLAKFDLRHRNRDLYRNMRKVKEVEKMAMNYADFCVTNAINLVDEGAYRTFKQIVAEEHFSQRLRLSGEGRVEAGVQTDESRFDKQGSGGAEGGSPVRFQQGELSTNEGNEASQQAPISGDSVLSALQRLRAQSQDSAELDVLAQLALSTAKPALDFGATIEPTLVQYSSSGRRQSLLQMGCVFEEDLRDPALRFLETTAETIDEEEDGEGEEGVEGESGSERDGSSKPSSRGSVSRSPSIVGSPATGSRPLGPAMLRKLFYSPSALARRSLAPLQNRRLSTRKFISSEAESVDLETLRADLTELMDRKLMKLYQGLDDRWKGLDETNLSILQKISRFQEVITVLNADNQRLQVTTQLLAQRLAKTDARILSALEPVYLALDEQKTNVTSLEGLMVEVSRQLRGLESRPVPTVVASQAELAQQFRPEQLPIELLLKNSQHPPDSSHPHPHNHHQTHQQHTQGGRNSAEGEYVLEGFSAPIPASTNMSEHELELILRQLKEYATLYEDMVHNYERVNKRLLEEDMRRSGNFSLTKPHVTRTVPIKPPAITIREIINTPFVHPAAESAEYDYSMTSSMTPHPPAASVHRDVIVHMPQTSQPPPADTEACIQEQQQQGESSEGCELRSGSPVRAAETPQLVSSQTGPLPAKKPFASPHRVLTEPFHLNKRGGASPPSALATRMGPLTKRDLLKLMETSDLSANVEIIRIKNELARLRSALSRKDTSSPPARQAGQHPPVVFPSLFSGLDSSGFNLAKTQAATPAGSALRLRTPQSRSGRFVEPGKPVLAGSLFPPGDQHASQRDRPSLGVTNGSPPKSAALTTRLYSASAQQQHGQVPSFDDSLSLLADPSKKITVEPVDALSAESSVVVPAHANSPIAPEADMSYHPSAEEDEDGLHEDSLSAYEFLIRPGFQVPVEALLTEPAQDSAGAITSVISAGDSVKSIDPPPTADPPSGPRVMSSPRGTLWGSAASIGHTTINSRINPGGTVTGIPRSSLLPSPATAAATAAAESDRSAGSLNRGAAPTSPKGSSAHVKASLPRALDMSLRAEAIAAGEMKGFALTGSVKTAAMASPSPPVVSRPPATKTGASGNVSRPSVARRSPAAATLATSATCRASKREVPGGAAWTDEQVWQRDYASADSVGSTVASTPSILLQGGEFVGDEGSMIEATAGATRGGLDAVEGIGFHGVGGSMDSLPANISRNLGENAFD